MQSLPVIACLALVASVAVALPDSQWALFKSMHGKSYASSAEELMRRQIFEANKERVEQFNAHEALEAGYTLGLNHMSDWTEEEYAKINGFRHEKASEVVNSAEAQAFVDEILNDDSPIPESVDWRKVKGRVSGVKNQGNCGSCWAFATTGVLEGQQLSGKGNYSGSELDPLSEEELVECSDKNWGCLGGLMSYALADIAIMGGIQDEKSYPYTAPYYGYCKSNKSKFVMTDKGFAMLPKGDEEALKKTVARYGPVSVSIFASFNLQAYTSGIFDDNLCSNKKTNHGVLVVGYGSEKGKDYWIVKNSWGEDWGMDGYVFMSRNKDNQCYIASFATLATF